MMRIKTLLMAAVLTSVIVPFSQSAIALTPINQPQSAIAISPATTPAVVDLSQANGRITAQNIPSQTIRKIKQDIQKRAKLPRGQIKLVSAQARSWDGCMGLAKPDTLCIQIAIEGWQVIMSGPNQRFWVYHVDQNGERLGFNARASLPTKSQIPVPRFIDRVIPPSEDNVLFQSALVMGETPVYTAIELRANGDNYLLTSRQIAPKMGKARVIKRLTTKQVQPFLDLLSKNSFSHFDRISYFNANQIAVDAPLWQLYGYGNTTEYTGGDEDKLPPKLGAIVRAWDDLVK
jgi:hypothetical protein